MIVDIIKKLHTYLPVHPLFFPVAEFMGAHTLSDFDTGKISLGRGITLGIDEYMTLPENEKHGEYHEKFIDLQLVLSGCEQIGYTSRTACELITQYDTERDVVFAEGEFDYFTLQPGNFALFFPHDVHKPGICTDTSEMVRKAVFKIPVSG